MVAGLVAQVLWCGGPQVSFLFFFQGCMKTKPVCWAGGQDVPGVNVRKLVWMTWIPSDMSLTQVIVARSHVPSMGHPTFKVGHSTSHKVWSFADFIGLHSHPRSHS
jgi:hypothetical protein